VSRERRDQLRSPRGRTPGAAGKEVKNLGAKGRAEKSRLLGSLRQIPRAIAGRERLAARVSLYLALQVTTFPEPSMPVIASSRGFQASPLT